MRNIYRFLKILLKIGNKIVKIYKFEKKRNMLEIGERPWGKYYVLEDEENYKLKRIEVNAGHRLSYQYHHHRQEFWTVVQGEAVVVLDGVEHVVKYGESIFIPLGAKHRIENRSAELLVFIEVQTGTYFGEDDIIRLEDDYARGN